MGIDVDRPYTRPATDDLIDLRLDANEGPLPGPTLRAAIAALGGETLRRYPDTSELEATWSAQLGIEARRLLVTAGADDAIDRVCRAALRDGGELILPTPSFEMIDRYTRLAGGQVRPVPWPRGAFPLEAVLEATTPDTRLVAVVSPNNPTGAVASAEQLRTLARRLPGVLILVDAAYAEFAEEDLSATALEFENCVALRTLSKAWGMAGLRVGCALGSKAWIDRLRAGGPPYAVSGVSLALARAALTAGHDEMRATVRRAREERSRISAALAEGGVEVQPSQANFVFGETDDPNLLAGGLRAQGIAIRRWQDRPELARGVRVSCPVDPEAMDRLEHAIRTTLQPQALLLDMDGVIADEGPSYRATIQATLADYGVTVSRRDVTEVKAEGNSNNDWVVTHRLLTRNGVEANYDDVVARFEEHYQGTEDAPGLCEREAMLVDPVLLETLVTRLPLAIVTGRPRRDAMRFLERFEITRLFTAIVTLDDVARPKPDPEPVRVALEQLGVQRAWMVGDTPDDVSAARCAGAIPFGICAPSDDDAVSGEALRAAGAARILDRLDDLQEMLP